MLRMLNRFARDRRGGMAVMGAVIALPLAFVAFAAVEYNRVTSTKEQLQRALDTATMAVALSSQPDPALLEQHGRTVLLNTLGAARGSGVLETVTFTPQTNGDMTGRATLSIRPIIAHLLYQGAGSSAWREGRLHLDAFSEVGRLGDRVEVALVLDNTYSMLTNDRIGLTKDAAKLFVDRLEASALRTGAVDALKISVVPFSTTVKVGAELSPGVPRTKANSPWLDWDALSSSHRQPFDAPLNPLLTPAANRMNLFTTLGVPWGGCVEARAGGHDVLDTPASTATPDTLFVPYFAPDEPASGWANPHLYYINNYIPDGVASPFERAQRNVEKYHAGAVPVTSAMYRNYVYGPNYGCAGLRPILPLSSNMTTVRSAIDAMTVIGDTVIPIGMAWGWHVLSPNSPFTSKGAAYGSVTKIVVLMTDGDNASGDNSTGNHSLYAAYGYMWQDLLWRLGAPKPSPYGTAAERKAALDARLDTLCSNIKAAGIVVYTVRVQQTGDATLMQGCASEPAKFHDVTDLSLLDDAFDAIAKSIVNMRVK